MRRTSNQSGSTSTSKNLLKGMPLLKKPLSQSEALLHVIPSRLLVLSSILEEASTSIGLVIDHLRLLNGGPTLPDLKLQHKLMALDAMLASQQMQLEFCESLAQEISKLTLLEKSE